MSDGTHIEWTDATWNPITGCSVVSAGCKHCYAMKLAGTRLQHHPSRAGLTIDTAAGPVWNGQVRFNEGWLDQPLRWRRPRRIFVCAHGDLFHESVPNCWIDKVFAVMACAEHHSFQVLTKHPERMNAYLSTHTRELRERWARAAVHFWGASDPDALFDSIHLDEAPHLPNVWLGVSVEHQEAADERIPLLLQCPAVVRWISAEPLLGPVDLERGGWSFLRSLRPPPGNKTGWERGLDWVVAGGESGTRARPMHPDWARSLRDQCAASGVPFLFKQWGAWYPDRKGIYRDTESAFFGDTVVHRLGKKAAGRMLDGAHHDGYPA